jgi:serine/threonine-protein kinase
MARVYLAQERHPPRKVAIKVMKAGVSTPVFRERFVREIELTSQLQHPHIVPVLAADECLFVPDGPEGLCYYVMPYIEGESLRTRLLRDKRIALTDALRITREVGSALRYAHARGVIHRDLKPENILFQEDHALLADFGIARAISAARQQAALTSPGEFVGSLAYMSPEQLAGDRPLDVRTDIYGLACVLHEMLTGAPPLLEVAGMGRGRRATLADALKNARTPRAVSLALRDVLAQALAGEPEVRPASVEELVDALEACATPGWRARVRALLTRGT